MQDNLAAMQPCSHAAMQPWSLGSSAAAAPQLLQLSCSDTSAVTAQQHLSRYSSAAPAAQQIADTPAQTALQPCSCAAMQPCSRAALQLCSLAAMQPCSLAALQPCSLAAMQPCSHAAMQPCSCGALQPNSSAASICSLAGKGDSLVAYNPTGLRSQ